MEKIFVKISTKVLILMSLVAIFGSIIYRLYKLNNIGVAVSLMLTVIVFVIINRFERNNNKKPTQLKIKEINSENKNSVFFKFVIPVFYLFLSFALFAILWKSQTTTSIISPWQVVPKYFFALFALLTFVLIIYTKFYEKLSLLFIIIYYLISFSVAVIIYKLGYGFDFFVHGATLELIDKVGAVYPKPFYYLGQYSLTIILHKLFFIPLVWLNKFLVSVLAGIFIPIFLCNALDKWFADKKITRLTTILILVIPFSFFIATTPQNLAYLFFAFCLLLGLNCKNTPDLITIYILALVALVSQPIAGIPAILFAVSLTIYHSDLGKIKNYLLGLIFILASIALPLALHIVNQANEAKLSGNNALSGDNNFLSLIPNLIMPGQENFILNFIYLYAFNLKLMIVLLAVAGIIIAFKNKNECKVLFLYFALSLSMFVSYLFSKNLSFDYLIGYEQANFTTRILIISAIFLLPFFLLVLYVFIEKITKQSKFIEIAFLLLCTIVLSTSLYISYPRFDNYFNSHGYSVSQDDIEAVNWINNNTANDYIVLANQQVSAAALSEFGFTKYYKDDIFYYPIPTGGPLYQYYLDMVYKKPSHKTAEKAMNLAGVKEAYFVLNKYWWAFPKILEEAKLEADSWQEIAGGNIFVFKYANIDLN